MKGWNYYETDLTTTIESNLISFFDWNLLDKGALVNVNIPTSGAYGGDFSRLRPSADPRYTTGTVWEGARGNWIWESGFSIIEPIRISGIFVNNVFQSTGYQIDYINGRVILSSAITNSSVVRVAHSYKEIKVESADNNEIIKKIQGKSRRIDNSNFMVSSGNFNLLPENRVQLPCIGISVYNNKSKGYELGGGHVIDHRIKIHILAEDSYTCKKIRDMITNQQDKSVYIYNLDLMIPSGFPLNIDGTLTSNPKVYPELIKHSGEGGYRYTNGIQYGKIFIKETIGNNIQNFGNIHYTVADMVTETIVNKI